MKKFFHILNDEKFTDWIINSFEKMYPNQNEFFLISNNHSSTYFADSKVQFITKSFFLNGFEPIKDSVFIFYYLHTHNISFLNKWKHFNYTKIWIGYGSDYYYYLLNSNSFHSLYLKNTSILFNNINGYNIFKRIILNIYQYFFFKLNVLPALKSLNYFAPIIPNEYELIRDRYKYITFDYLEFTFGDLSYILSSDEFTNGNDILLGNSATFSTNHIDILDSFKDLNVLNKIILPLSYGNAKYKDYLLKIIPDKYPEFKIQLLDKFLPLNIYNSILNKCGFAIMPHLRQQAMGNIYSLLYSGTKLFLFKANPVYDFLRKINIIFYSIEDLLNDPSLLSSTLSFDDQEINREIIIKYYSKEKSYQRIRDILESEDL